MTGGPSKTGNIVTNREKERVMSDYEIGRDLQDLRSRVERLEESLGGRHAASQMLGMGSSERHQTRAGVELNAKPSIWESDKHVPLFMHALLGLPSGLK